MAIRIKEQSAWRSQVLVIKALLQRELITRFGKYKLGAVWIFLDPLMQVLILGVVLGPLLGRASADIPYPFFLICGYMLLSLLTGPITSSLNAITANQGLLVFKKVKALDPFIARYIFELFTALLALTAFCIVAYWSGWVEISLEHIPKAAVCIAITWIIGCGLGLQAGIASLKYQELEKVIGYIQRPLLFVSAVVFPLNAIPPQYAKYLLYNPLVHTIESIRMCLFPTYHSEGVNLYYPAAWALCSITL